MVYQKNRDATRALVELRCSPPDAQMILLLLACEPAVERKCWGERLVDVQAGASTYCMVDSDGCLECRYYEKDGRQHMHVPIESVPEGKFQSVSLTQSNWTDYGAVAGCAVDTDNHPHCWEPAKKNFVGESSPSIEERVTVIGNHESSPCAARVDGGAYCWGEGGSLDIDVVFTDLSIRTRGRDRFALSAEGDLYSWSVKVTDVDMVEGPYVAIDGAYPFCAIHQQDGLKCWDYLFQDPYFVDPGIQGKALCYGGGENCVLGYDGSVTCDDLSPDFDVPLTTLSCSYEEEICGITESGEGRCWSKEKGMWKLP